MFSSRSLADDLEEVRRTHASGSPVLDVESDFETLPPAVAEDIGLFVDGLSPASYPAEWLPANVPAQLRRYAGSDFTIGLPGDGTVVRTTQTTPDAILVKRRAETTPDEFLAFLIAERLVQVGVTPSPNALPAENVPRNRLPESFLPFFGPLYADLDAAVRGVDRGVGDAAESSSDDVEGDGVATEGDATGGDAGSGTTGFGPNDVFQVAAALFDAWVGLHTREVFSSWSDRHPRLFDAWMDAGDRLSGRLDELSAEVARGETRFPSATEYACSAVRHGLELPPPFAALDTTAYRERGAPYAVKWAEKTFESMAELD